MCGRGDGSQPGARRVAREAVPASSKGLCLAHMCMGALSGQRAGLKVRGTGPCRCERDSRGAAGCDACGAKGLCPPPSPGAWYDRLGATMDENATDAKRTAERCSQGPSGRQ